MKKRRRSLGKIAATGILSLSMVASSVYVQRPVERMEAAETYDVNFTAAELQESDYAFYSKVQEALDQGRDQGTDTRPYVIHIPAGQYLLMGTLRIYNNTKLIADPKAVIRTGGTDDNKILIMLVNGNYNFDVGEDEYQGYGSYRNITVQGGVWDGNSGNFREEKPVLFRFAHGKDIEVRDAVFQNVKGNHHMEAAAVDGFTVSGCTFKDARSSGDPEVDSSLEALQIDLTSEDYPGFKTEEQEYDNLPCKNVTVRDCDFKNVFRGVGSHHPEIEDSDGIQYENIVIANNRFSNVADVSILGWLWKDAVIAGNETDTVAKEACINMQTCENSTITGNTVSASKTSGIVVDNGSVNEIADNSISGSKDNGIGIQNAEVGSITGNHITKSGKQGISLSNTSVSDAISGNILTDNEGTQISLSSTDPANETMVGSIEKNVITGGNYGIIVGGDSQSGDIVGNTISSPKKSGISIHGATAGNIGAAGAGNTITKPGKTGITVNSGACVKNIAGNQITSSTANSIVVNGSGSRAEAILSNQIKGSGKSGIVVTDGAAITGDVRSNTVDTCKEIGIYANSSIKNINGNTVKNTTKHGIHTNGAQVEEVSGNKITGGFAGISCKSGSVKKVNDNVSENVSGSGITVTGIKTLQQIKGNRINKAGNIGISVAGSTVSELINNQVAGAKRYGISINSGADVLVTGGNTGSNNAKDGAVSKDSKGLLYINNSTKVSLKDGQKMNKPYCSSAAGAITYKVTDGSVAAVDAAGKVKGLKLGSTTVEAEQSGHRASGGKIQVVAAPTKVNVNKKKVNLKVGKKFTIKVSVNAGATCGKYTFKTSKKKVATVTAKGVIKAKKKGKATITVKSYNGKKVKVTVVVKKK